MTAGIANLVHVLDTHGPVTLRQAAKLLGTDVASLRAQVRAFTDVETAGHPLDPLLEIFPADGWPEDGPDPAPSDTDLVAFARDMDSRSSGISHQDAAVLGPLLEAAEHLRAMEPDNLVLAAAADKLAATLMRGTVGQATYRARVAADLQRAVAGHRQVELTYSNAWLPRVRTRIVDPYRVVSTARGYELDAGPLDDQGRPRTYLLSRVRDYRTLESHFADPAGLAQALAANRRLVAVTGYAVHSGLWAIRAYAERCEYGAADAEGTVFTAWLLPPVPDRAGLMMLLAGADSYLDDADLDSQRLSWAADLAAHHGLTGSGA